LAEDLAQEALVAALEHWPRLAAEGALPAESLADMVRQLDDPNAGRPPLTKWRAMTGPELAARLDYLHGMGLRVVRLTPNTTPFESYLDAGGHVAPHGLEQLQRLLDALDARGLRALINLFHYAYGSPATGSFPPVAAYGQAGYLGLDDWGQPAAVALQRGYLAELLAAIGSDPAVLGYTLFGENDDLAGEAWLNSTAEFVRSRAARQRLVFEQGGGPQSHRDNRPDRWDVFTPARDGGVGYRTYYSEGTPVDAYANLAARWYALTQPAFLAETCSDGPGWHGRLTWLHPDFITQLRDSLWASLLAPQAMALTWSVCLIEPERIVPTAVAERLDWQRLRRAQGLVAMRVAHPNRELLPVMAAFDQACCQAGVTYDFLPLEADPAGYGLVFDAARDRPPFDLEAVLPRAPIKVSAGNAATVLLDAESRQMAAYVRNVVEHRAGPGYGAGTQELHRQRSAPREVLVELRALPDQARLTVWDLDTREVVCEGRLGDHRRLALGRSAHDFALVASTH
ncbi:MAG: hypothetical protein HUU35_19035, partial [Armatimonadetes bacterium]|nr:hypothetical protein [Armatimonadota bacterium]